MSRKRIHGDGEEIDRASHLSDDILHHILSLLDDTKTAVKTSLLSKRWRHLWKDVPVLSLDQNSFRTGNGYTTFVLKLLSHRSDRATIDKVSFTSNRRGNSRPGLHDRGMNIESFDAVLGYAGRTGRDYDRRLRALSVRHSYASGYSTMVESIVRHKHQESLEALELTGFIGVIPGDSNFRMLKSLSLVNCRGVDLGEVSRCFGAMTTLVLSQDELIFHDEDPFAGIPHLRCLKILHCRSSCRSSSLSFRVSGIQLLELEIRCWAGEVRCSFVTELLTPKLESFCFGSQVVRAKLGELSFPFLEHASIYLLYHYPTTGHDDFGWTHEVMKLLRGLRNAKSLDLHLEDTCVNPRQYSPFVELKPKILKEVSQFTRLKTSRIRYTYESPDDSTN